MQISSLEHQATKYGADDKGFRALRDRLSDWLPDYIFKAVSDYSKFTNADPPQEPKSFASYQAACRAALAHIHLLVGLARWVGAEAGSFSEGVNEDLERLLHDASLALSTRPPDDTIV